MEFPRIIPVFISTVSINTGTLLDKHIQYHDFDYADAFVYKDKYTALLQQENYKTLIGVYMNQSQPKAIRYPLTWTLKLCLMPCIFSEHSHSHQN